MRSPDRVSKIRLGSARLGSARVDECADTVDRAAVNVNLLEKCTKQCSPNIFDLNDDDCLRRKQALSIQLIYFMQILCNFYKYIAWIRYLNANTHVYIF